MKHRRQCRHKFFVCRSCFGIFGNWQHLFDHKVKHRQSDPDWDGIRFSHRSDSNAEHRCGVSGCDRKFADLRSLTKHRRVHSKPFRCTAFIGGALCGKTFSNKRNLTVHARSHSNDRREKCHFCCRAFCDPSTLRNHIKALHSEVVTKAFSCRVCQKRFGHKHALQKHLEIHSNAGGRRTFRCASCDMTFTAKSNKIRHDKKYHGVLGAARIAASFPSSGAANDEQHLFHCTPCGKSWTRKSDKARHDRFHHKVIDVRRSPTP